MSERRNKLFSFVVINELFNINLLSSWLTGDCWEQTFVPIYLWSCVVREGTKSTVPCPGPWPWKVCVACKNVAWFEGLTAVNMKMAVFWVVVPCRLVWVYRHFRGLYCLHPQGDQSTRCYNSESSHLHVRMFILLSSWCIIRLTNLYLFSIHTLTQTVLLLWRVSA
jgi:hypothetical protein